MNLCIFEDRYWEDLLPLTYARPAFSLLCGTRSLLDKARSLYPGASVRLTCRPYLKDLVAEQTGLPVNETAAPDDTLFINGRVLLKEALPPDGPESFALQDGALRFARLTKRHAMLLTPEALLGDDPAAPLRGKVAQTEFDLQEMRHYWDLVNANTSEIERELAGCSGAHGTLYEGVHLVNRQAVFIGEGAKIKPGVVIDAEEGPVHIGAGTVVNANSSIEGPVFIGCNCVVQAASRIRPGSTLGDVSKVGGEIEESIIHGYSNKQHDGFLGHAYVGSWVNLAADTINSDLKNTYGAVRVSFGRRIVETDEMFVGLAVGDHSKSAVNSSFLTGSVVGFGANVVMSSFPPKFVPSFSWCTDGGIEPYRLEKALEVARIVMRRRKRTMSLAEERVFRKIHELTTRERETVFIEREE